MAEDDMSEQSGPSRELGAVSAWAGLGGALLGGLAPSAPHLWLLCALGLVLGVPTAAASGRAARGASAGGAWLLGVGLLAALRFEASGAALGVVYLAGLGAALLGLTRLSARGGQALASGLGLVALAAPYLAGALGLEPASSLELALHSPLSVLCGTCAGSDLLRAGSLYRLLPAAQSVPYAYPAPATALLSAWGLAALSWAPLLLRGRRAPLPAPVAAGLLLGLLLLGAPSQAQAQGLFPAPSGADPGAAGDLQTRVRLGYYLPELRGELRVDGAKDSIGRVQRGDRINYDRHIDLNQQFLVPTFEVELAWANVGGLRLQYLEAVYQGETQNNLRVFQFEEQRINVANVLDTRFRFRTIALGGHIDIPLASFATLRLMSTFRYFKNEVKIRASPQGISARNSQEAIVPTVGGGLDVSIWNVIYAYGDIQWLDFRTSWLGAQDKRWRFRYREWRAGVRLELVQHAHIMVEWYSLELDARDYETEQYDNWFQGVRVMVAIQF